MIREAVFGFLTEARSRVTNLTTLFFTSAAVTVEDVTKVVSKTIVVAIAAVHVFVDSLTQAFFNIVEGLAAVLIGFIEEYDGEVTTTNA